MTDAKMFHPALRFVDEIARCGSIRKAADKLHLSASAVNRQLLQLEEDLGVPLFDRLARGVRLTAAGEILLGQVRRWDLEGASLRARLQSLAGGTSGQIRIAAPELTTEKLLPDAMHELHRQFPRFEFNVFTGDTPAIINALLARQADVGLVFNFRPGPLLRNVLTVQQTYGAVMVPDHPLAHRTEVALSECGAWPLILPSEDWSQHTMTSSVIPSLGEVQVLARGGRASVLRSLARSGLGIAFLTRVEVEADLEAGRLVLVPLNDRRIRPPSLSLLVPTAQSSTGVIAVFIQKLQEGLQRTAEPAAP